ncbi:hypothetical protein HYD82_02300 [Mycoplasmopsis bovis]|nr:hypothetical protein [Mycoplasmopsis bovis]QQH18829.1 hypothetical protein HYE49_02195 [Mycoplasmopsis bovis]QQH19061.1 hypothetical protein HYE48_02210 [Mycoplasmopsis bovis]QQH20202.1 hypothetical protein HYE43_02130 [Mycoplasmopsis bovis]QQH22288.1 hypothetical protein HYE32_02215 [Mycoplasmopsis bovis]QQH23689.1 hypothetical protein HYE24_02200 [Mycoplasmopsis bovis]
MFTDELFKKSLIFKIFGSSSVVEGTTEFLILYCHTNNKIRAIKKITKLVTNRDK